MSNAYKNAGVDVNRGYEAVNRIKKYAKATNRPGVMSQIGSFAGLFDLKPLNMKEPVLVSGTDGVGTKLLVAQQFNRHNTVGQDLVAMCVNDIIASGATPLFFLDYIAVEKIDPDHIEELMKGIYQGCKLADCALIGGETAEMPDMYHDGHYDLAGFAVGAVEKNQIITGETIISGDVVIGLPSSGLHSNGYSLVRKILFKDHHQELDGKIIDQILEPTKIYVKPILNLLSKIKVKGIAHITGGGFDENIPRILPENVGVSIDTTSFIRPEIYHTLQKMSLMSDREMFQVFNMGIGMIVVIDSNDVNETLQLLQEAGEDAKVIGSITNQEGLTFLW